MKRDQGLVQLKCELKRKRNGLGVFVVVYLLGLVYTSDGSDGIGVVSGVGIGRKF